jgi:hypothetical protein
VLQKDGKKIQKITARKRNNKLKNSNNKTQNKNRSKKKNNKKSLDVR